ncbi:MAG: sigma-70 family RNA polymerase sigma factor [Anaerolineae bacterium]|nr:sigma-70 family RNA polymerase sigma factor [Anaerolineae bacterium]
MNGMNDSCTDLQLTDRQLVTAIGRGDMRALDALYTRHGARLLAYVIGQVGDRGLAEEVLQDVMLAVWRGAAHFRGDSRVTTWLLAITRRRAISARQRRGPDHVWLADMADTVPADTSGPPEVAERHDDQHAVRAALAQLPPDQRETLELVFYHGLTGPEVAEVLGIAPGTVKSRLHRAKTLLHRLLCVRERIDG